MAVIYIDSKIKILLHSCNASLGLGYFLWIDDHLVCQNTFRNPSVATDGATEVVPYQVLRSTEFLLSNLAELYSLMLVCYSTELMNLKLIVVRQQTRSSLAAAHHPGYFEEWYAKHSISRSRQFQLITSVSCNY